MASDRLLLGFDVGTTSTKGGVFDLDGNLLAFDTVSYGIVRPKAKWAEQDPEAWWEALLAVLKNLRRAADLSAVAAVGVCSQVNTHVFVDASGEALGPAIVWQDQRCSAIAEQMNASLSEDDRHRLWGGPFSVDASFLLPRLAWFRRHRPEHWSRVRWVLSPKDYLNLRLTGEAATDVISPIGLVGPDLGYLGDVFALEPEAEADRLMPPLRPFTHVLGPLVREDAGLPKKAVAVVGTMDAWANLYGSGVVEPGQAMEVAGTSEIVGVLSDRSKPTAGVITFVPIDGFFLHAGPTQAGGDALRWFAEINGLGIEDALAEAASVPSGDMGLVFLPHLLGERAPLWDSDLRGLYFGLSASHGRGHLTRALLEGVAFSARHLLEAAEEAAGHATTALRSSGGAARSDLWCQIKADVLGRDVHRLVVPQSGVLGAALIAGVGAGLLPRLPEAAAGLVRVERVFRPEPEHRGAYDELYALYRDLQSSLRPAHRRLARFRELHA